MSGMGMMLAMGMGSPGSGGATWPPAGASLSADFTSGAITGAASIAAAFNCVRNTVGWAEDSLGNWTSFAANTLRITDKGLLSEEIRTNPLASNMAGGVGGVIGSGGQYPTSWGAVFNPSLTLTVSYLTIKGLPVFRIRVTGTPTSITGQYVNFQSTSAFTGNVAASCFAAISGGSLANIAEFQLRRSQGHAGTPINLTNVLTRYSDIGNVTLANVTSFRFGFADTVTPVDITVDLACPQREDGFLSVTSPIVGGAATPRGSDVITVNTPDAYASLAQGSLFTEVQNLVTAGGANRAMTSLFVDANNRIYTVFATGSGVLNHQVQTAGVGQASMTSSLGSVIGGYYKFAHRWNTNDVAMRWSSNLGPNPPNDTTATMPTGAFIIPIGDNGAANAFFNGYIRRVAFFLTPLTDAQLAAMV